MIDIKTTTRKTVGRGEALEYGEALELLPNPGNIDAFFTVRELTEDQGLSVLLYRGEIRAKADSRGRVKVETLRAAIEARYL